MSAETASRTRGAVDEGRRRRQRRAEEARQVKRLRRMTTPEGAELNLRLANAAERAGAFMIDFTIQVLVIIAGVWTISSAASAFGFNGWAIAGGFAAVFVFAVRNFYFIDFDIGSKAATPGKRALGLRVAARDGGRLTANAVLARNFMREIEVFLPLQFLVMSAFSDQSDVSGWIALSGLVWTGVLVLLPVFNRDKLRAGDIVAGTWVIHAPKTKLLTDIASAPRAADSGGVFAFTPAQLDAYGIHELHVLEDVLRQSAADVKASVAARIRQKIDWSAGPQETDIAFLEAYYAALRGRLEQRMLFGERKADKYG